jgi:hypothetical protein
VIISNEAVRGDNVDLTCAYVVIVNFFSAYSKRAAVGILNLTNFFVQFQIH